MKLHRIKLILWAISLLFLLVSIAIAVIGFKPLHTQSIEDDITYQYQASSGASDKIDDEIIPLESFAKIWSLKLRKPLYDPPKAPQKDRFSKPKTVIDIELLGLINEPGHSRAIIRTRDRQSKLLSVGEVLVYEAGIIKIVSIDEESITIGYDGENITIDLNKKKNENE